MTKVRNSDKTRNDKSKKIAGFSTKTNVATQKTPPVFSGVFHLEHIQKIILLMLCFLACLLCHAS